MAKKILFSGLRITGLVFCVLFIYMSCTTNTKPRLSPKHEGIHTEFQPYIQEFFEISNGTLDHEDFKNLSVAFSEQEDTTVGVCWSSINWKEIEVDNMFWKYASPLKRKALIFHELGHCLLSRGHANESTFYENILNKIGFDRPKTEKFADGCYKTIMVTHMLPEKCLKRHMRHYEKELFQKHRKKMKDRFRNKICKDVEIINNTKSWTERDRRSFRSAANTCNKKYNSCLRVFYKNKEREYRAICK